jgi:predicted AAA+ superfamily ATPase
MLINRKIETELKIVMKEYPVVTITGPRQSGKTTLAKKVYPNYNYCNLEFPDIRQLAEDDPRAFFNRYKTPLIIDEIQRVPQLLSYIQGMVDEEKENGMFLLTGSQQFLLNDTLSQSLAGRNALLSLLPLSIEELKESRISFTRDELIYKGFLPKIYSESQNPTRTYRNYLQTYIDRDLKQITQINNLPEFETFLRLLAGRTGQLLNLSTLSNDIGISSTTLKSWLNILETSYIVFKIYPYFENFGKRLIKSPKLYFTDIGLVSYLIGIDNVNQVSRDPIVGGLFENMIALEAIKNRLNLGYDHQLYFYRDNKKNEVDLIYKKQNQLIPIEIKSAMTFNKNFAKGIHYFRKITTKASKGFVIYSGDLVFESDDYSVLNFENTERIFEGN